MKLGMIDLEYAPLTFDSVVQLRDGIAMTQARIGIGIGGHVVHVDLPAIEMLPTE